MSYLHLRLSVKQSWNSQVVPAPKHEAWKSLRRFCGRKIRNIIWFLHSVHHKNCSHKKINDLLTVMLFQNHMTFFLLQNTNVEIINNNVSITLFHAITRHSEISSFKKYWHSSCYSLIIYSFSSHNKMYL